MSVHFEARLSHSGIVRQLAARLGLSAAIGTIIVATLAWFGFLAWGAWWLIATVWQMI